MVDFIEDKNPYVARGIAIDIQEACDNLKRLPKLGLPVLKPYDPELIHVLYINQSFALYVIGDHVIFILEDLA